MQSLHIAVFTDTRFANNEDNASQLGYIICMMDNTGAANLLLYGSQKCKRVTRSVLAAELYAMILGFDNGFLLRKLLCEMISPDIPLKIFTDSRCLFDAL